MIQIILTDPQSVNPDVDDLGRSRTGYAEGMSPLALYNTNRGHWAIGQRADTERYVVFVYKGTGVQVIEVTHVHRTPNGRAVFDGLILEPGHPVYDRYVGQPAPNPNVRNPVTYFDSEFDTPCGCGCGETTTGGKRFIHGHEQTALHDRVRQVGTVAEFIDWFDTLAAPLRA